MMTDMTRVYSYFIRSN